jgi:SRSO17 transposase
MNLNATQTFLHLNLNSALSFFKRFKPHFPVKMFERFTCSLLALFLEHKRGCFSTLAEKIHISYQKLQYFISDSKWHTFENINRTRLNFIYSHKATAPFTDGVVVIDDTANPKPFSKKTQAVAYQYCNPLKRNEYCHSIVFSAYADANKHFPVHFQTYKPACMFELGEKDPLFRSKIEIAAQFIKNLAQQPSLPRTLVLDSWYACSELINLSTQLNFTFISELKCNRYLLLRQPGSSESKYIKAERLVEIIRTYYPHKVKYFRRYSSDGSVRSVPYFVFQSKLKGINDPVKVVVIPGKLFEGDEDDCHVLFSTDTKLSGAKIIQLYSLRWGIERTFAELKELFYFDQYQSAKLKTIERYWMLVIIAWTLAYRLKQCGALTKVVSAEQKTLADTVRAVRALIEQRRHLKLISCKPEISYGIRSRRAIKRAD